MNLCFVGYGSIAVEHVKAFRQLEDVGFDTVVGRVPESTEAFAREHGFAHTTLELNEALARPEIDAVVICSPSDVHAAQTEAALRAGKHVLVEIPLGMNLADCQRVAAVAREVDRTLMVAHTQRFFPALQELRRRIEAGELQPHHLVCRWFFLRRANVNWKGRQRSWTDNLLWHHACHVVDAALWLLGGEGEDVRAQFGPPSPELDIPLDLDVAFRASNGALVSVSMSYNSHWPVHDYICVGEEETLCFTGGELQGPDGTVFRPEEPQPIREQNREFVAAVREGREPSVSADAVLPAMRVLQAAQDQLLR